MDVSVHSNWLSSTIGIQLIWTKYPLSNNNMDSKDKRCKFLLKEVPYQQNKSPLKFFIPKKWTMYWTTIRIRHSKLHTKPIYLATTQSKRIVPNRMYPTTLWTKWCPIPICFKASKVHTQQTYGSNIDSIYIMYHVANNNMDWWHPF